MDAKHSRAILSVLLLHGHLLVAMAGSIQVKYRGRALTVYLDLFFPDSAGFLLFYWLGDNTTCPARSAGPPLIASLVAFTVYIGKDGRVCVCQSMLQSTWVALVVLFSFFTFPVCFFFVLSTFPYILYINLFPIIHLSLLRSLYLRKSLVSPLSFSLCMCVYCVCNCSGGQLRVDYTYLYPCSCSVPGRLYYN